MAQSKEQSGLMDTAERVAIPAHGALGLYYAAVGALGLAAVAGGIAFALYYHRRNSRKKEAS
jgi:hypothetical protein